MKQKERSERRRELHGSSLALKVEKGAISREVGMDRFWRLSPSANSVQGQQDPCPISRESQILPTHRLALEVNSPQESPETNSALPTA